MRDLARQHTDRAIDVLVSIMHDPKAPHSSRISAATQLLDRAYGRPPQEQHITYNRDDNTLEQMLADIEADMEIVLRDKPIPYGHDGALSSASGHHEEQTKTTPRARRSR